MLCWVPELNCIFLWFQCVLYTIQQEHLLRMEVSFLRLSGRELDKKSSENKRKGYWESYYIISWRRGSLAIFQSLALNLHTVLTALVIWFPRWQIGNSKLQLGRLLVAGTLIAETTADGKEREAKLCIPAQSCLSCARGKTITKKKKKTLTFFPLFRNLLYMTA